jgi:2-amino-4-hydroxy-6-hydroxymethyldihydropteridine diphosphokinase
METKDDRLDEAVIVALGSNLKGGYETVQVLLEAALATLRSDGLNPVRCSSWWRSTAWPNPIHPDYLNGVVIVETKAEPFEVLAALRRIEAAFGRRRDLANAPRTLDLDLIAHGRTRMDDPDLVLPHPRAAERRFVMGPLAEIAPGWVHPGLGKTAQALAAAAEVGRDARPM